MKRIVNILILSFILLLLATGCNNETKVKNKPIETDDNIPLASNVDTTNSGTRIDSTRSSEVDNTKLQEGGSIKDKINENFYGKWVVMRTIVFGRVSALSDEDINNFIGKEIEYSKSKAMFESTVCENPTYKISTISEEDFFITNGYVNFKDLGYQGEEIAMIEVINEKGYYSELSHNRGGRFFVKDNETLLLNYGGVFFELKRAK